MKNTLTIALCLSAIFLGGCNKADNIAIVDGEGISAQEFAAYLKVKRLAAEDDSKKATWLESYANRAGLAAAIENTEKLDAEEVAVEVAEFKKQLVISKYFEDYLQEGVTDSAVQNYYVANEEKYTSEKIHVAHILFRVNEKMSESERQVLLTKAHEVYSKLQGGADFAELAKTTSQDVVSAKKGGDIGWISAGAISDEFSEKAFAMKKDEVSQPFLTAFGFHIIKVLENVQVTKKPLEAVKGEIRYQLRKEAKTAEIERLMSTVNVEIKKG